MPLLTGPQSKIPSNKLYTNTQAIQSSITDIHLSSVQWVADPTILGGLSTPGGIVLRDMGKNVYSSRNIQDGEGQPSTILRKIQLVLQGNQGQGGKLESSDYYTGYIPLGVHTSGANGSPCGVVRLN